MRREDVLVEVRDVTLARVGIITTKFLKLNATLLHNDVGQWSVTLPGDHPMVPHLAADGSGIIVSLRGETRFSGSTTAPKRKRDRQNPDGTFTFVGTTDTQILADARAYPQPGNSNPSTQTQSNDTRTGNAETIMRQYVAFNIANGALASPPTTWAQAGRLAGHRLKLRLETTNLNRGISVTKSPRFQILLELLQEIATLSGLGFRVVQRGGVLVFEIVTLNDRSDLVRLDINNGTLTSEEVSKTPPVITRAIVAGQGEGVDRQIVQRTSADSLAAEAAWGRVIETFIDQRDTNVTAELNQSGDEQLLAGGFTSTSVKVIPSDDQTMLYAVDWLEGDTIAVVVNGEETKTTVTAAAIVLDDKACAVGAAIGDVTGFRREDALAKRVEKTEQRVDSIERSVEVSSEGYVPALADPNADRILFWDDSAGAYAWLATSGALAIAGTTISVAAATSSAAGISELATPAEAVTGTSTTLVVTPEGLAAAVAAAAAALVPAGTIVATGASAAPAGWELCDGGTTSRTGAGAALFAAIGTQYGVGNGSTTFTRPNLKGRAIVGIDSAQTEFDVRGETGGAKTVTIATTNLPQNVTVEGIPGGNLGTAGNYNRLTALGAGNYGIAMTNLPPYIALNYIIKL